jgi:hypothetical protein
MDQQQSFRSTLVGWLKEVVPFNRLDVYVRKTRESFDDNPHAGRRANHVNYLLVTARHSYSISAYPDYLGCVASCTFYRPGENWTRGNDLPDGKFCRETWEAIKDAIIRYELVKLEPLPDPSKCVVGPEAGDFRETPEEAALREAEHELWLAKEKVEAAKRAVLGFDKDEPEMPRPSAEA